MRILQIIHGYPPRFNAGSEVYTQTLCRALADRHEVHVFTREEDPFAPDARLRVDADVADPRIRLHLVNNPRNKDRYRDHRIDARFQDVLADVRPDVVHVQHLNHLSTSLVFAAATQEIPIVYTLHDYWIMCPRGQFLHMYPEDETDPWAVCHAQEDRRCAERCYARYFSGAPDEMMEDIRWWTGWVKRRMRHLRQVVDHVDLFVAPARYLEDRFRHQFGIPGRKLVYRPYGFDLERLRGRRRRTGEPFTFGYIGTHIPAKGIQILLEAFGRVPGTPRLLIWGRPRPQNTDALRALADRLPGTAAQRVAWRSEYLNENIVRDVFDQVDAVVVPSIWVENAPLVIHEAQQARVPVITAGVGGMAELVRHEENGLLFEHRSIASLSHQMRRLAEDPALARRLGSRGYLGSLDGDVVSIQEHAREVEALYHRVIQTRNTARVTHRRGPWRITFDTNPDTCNLNCLMCEEHALDSPKRVARRQSGRPRRIMPVDIIRRVVAETAPYGLKEVIPSTMGEPLLYAEFEEVLAICTEHGVKLNLTTNGTFPRLGAQAWAERLVPVTSDVKISINGATRETQETIMRGSNFSRLLENVATFVAIRDAHARGGGNRCRVTFQVTFMEANVAELADIVRLAGDLGVDRVKGHHVWTHFRVLEAQSLRRNPEAIRRWNRAVEAAYSEVERLRRSGRSVFLDNVFRLDEQASEDLAPGGPCPFLGQEAWVSAEGRFDPCCAPDAERRTLGNFGNLQEQSLMSIWNGPAYRRLVATYRTRALCIGCNMRRPIPCLEQVA